MGYPPPSGPAVRELSLSAGQMQSAPSGKKGALKLGERPGKTWAGWV